MVKKKHSRQTIAIVILVVLLLLTICFGGVYAFYSIKTNKVVTGKILMANLKIDLTSKVDDTESTKIVITNGTNIVPDQLLENTPLIIKNSSSVSVYLMVVYELAAVNEKGEYVVDTREKPVLDIGYDYYMSATCNDLTKNTDWIDYLFKFNNGQQTKTYRCLISTRQYVEQNNSTEEVVVIKKDNMKLSKFMGNEYQSSNISFTFQAFAISSKAESIGIENESSRIEKCEKIASAIYESQDYSFLELN